MAEVPGTFPITARRATSGQAVSWWSAAFAWLFADVTGLFVWIAMELCVLVATTAVQAAPLLGWIGSVFLGILLQAGLMAAARRTAQEGATRFEDLFGGFGPRAGELLLLGLLTLLAFAAWLGIMLVAGAGTLFSTLGGAWSGSSLTLDTLPSLDTWLALLGVLMTGLLLLVPIGMAFWLAPALVVLDGVRALDAVRLSFLACWRNPLSLLVYGLLLFALAIAALLPLGLGFLILLPLMTLAKYACYRDVFGAAGTGAAAALPSA
jgi:hypothetical protein